MYKSIEIQVPRNHKHWKKCDEMCFYAKNVYNSVCYFIRQEYEKGNGFPDNKKLYNWLKPQPCWKESGHRAITIQAMRATQDVWKSFFAALREYRKNPGKFKACPRPPRYKHSTNGRFTSVFIKASTGSTIAPGALEKGKMRLLGNCKIEFNIPEYIKGKEIRTVNITPGHSHYSIVINYLDKEPKKIKLDDSKFAGIDLGVNNLITLTSNTGANPLLINGRPLKSINQFYNKKVARLKSQLPAGLKSSNKVRHTTRKRNNKVNDYVHHATNLAVKWLIANQVKTLVIGNNQGWKQNINIGKRNNQNFVSIPFHKVINQLTYKFEASGGEVIVREESYTSKASFLDNDFIPTYSSGQPNEVGFSGKRVKRGLYKSSGGKFINADVNASYNIIRKEFPKCPWHDGIEGAVVRPVLVNPLKVYCHGSVLGETA